MECQYSVEVIADSLHEAAVLGIVAMNVKPDALHLRSFDIAIKEPVIYRRISGPMLSAWLAQPGKNETQQALKERLGGLLRGK
jgi:hypothetical protein